MGISIDMQIRRHVYFVDIIGFLEARPTTSTELMSDMLNKHRSELRETGWFHQGNNRKQFFVYFCCCCSYRNLLSEYR